jgi:hypothetical protein
MGLSTPPLNSQDIGTFRWQHGDELRRCPHAQTKCRRHRRKESPNGKREPIHVVRAAVERWCVAFFAFRWQLRLLLGIFGNDDVYPPSVVCLRKQKHQRRKCHRIKGDPARLCRTNARRWAGIATPHCCGFPVTRETSSIVSNAPPRSIASIPRACARRHSSAG